MDREKVIKELHDARRYLEDKEWSDRGASPHIDAINDALALLKEQPEIVRCKDCKNWIPGYITDQDDFIPPKCGKYQQMVGHSSDDFCSLAERNEGR